MNDIQVQRLIYLVLPKILGELGAVKKSKSGRDINYKYRSIDDFLNALHPLLAKYSCFIVPSLVSRTNQETQSKSGNKMHYSIITYNFKLYATDGSYIEGIVDGESLDNSDKGSGKCLSYALKYFLITVFSIPTEDIEDTDFDTVEASQNKVKTGSLEAIKNLSENLHKDVTNKTQELIEKHNPLTSPQVTKEQIEQIRKIRATFKWEPNVVIDTMKTVVNKDNIYDVTKDEASLVIAMLNKRGKEETKAKEAKK